MRIKILGFLFLLGALIAGGGIDIGSTAQTIAGTILGFAAGGLLIIETNKKDYKRISDNTHSYPCFLRK